MITRIQPKSVTNRKNIAGFTLIEVVVVIVILAVVAGFSTFFVVGTTRSFVAVSQKSSLLSKSRLATEYMIRRLRNALPYSLRITNSDSCLQFMPIVTSGLYLDIVPSVVNGGPANGNTPPISLAPFTFSSGSAEYLSIGASANTEVYGTSPGSIAAIQSTTSTSVTLVNNKQWLRNSINQRFYMVDRPSAFCLVNNEIRFYQGLSIADSVINTASSYDLLADSVTNLGQLFTLSSAIEDRNIRVTLSLLFSLDDHRLEAIKQVVVRNVP